MRKPLLSWWCAVVVTAAVLGLAPAVVGVATAAPIPTVGDRDGDGVGDDADPCPDTAATPSDDDDDGFAGCARIGQQVYPVLNAGRVSGQVFPVDRWHMQDVCRAGIELTLRATWYTDHDPATEPGGLTEVETSDAGGFFTFDAQLPLGTEYSIEASPRAIVGDQAYCASARTSVHRHVATVAREVDATYKNLTGKVTGRARVLDGSGVDGACSDEQTATLWRRFDDRAADEIASTRFSGADETFTIDSGELVTGASYYVEIAERGPQGFPDVCRAARTELTVADQDDDGVPDAADECDHVPGPLDGDVPGCAPVERRITADDDDARVFGELTVSSFPPGAGNPCESPMRIEVSTVDDQGRRTPLTSGWSSGGAEQAYSLPLSPPLPSGTRYVVSTPQVLQPGIALCGAAESAIRASDDPDRDGIAGDADACPTVPGQGPVGCPTVTRTVTADYRAGQVVGKVTVTDLGGAPTGACGLPALLQVWQIGPQGEETRLGSRVSSLPGGGFSIPLALEPGTRVLVAALVSGDPGIALCAAARSTPVVAFGDRDDDTVPDADDDCPDVSGPTGETAGCPVVQRIVAASYAVGRVTGTARPVGSTAPSGACAGAPVVVSYAGAGDAQVRVDGTVGPGGAFEVEVGRPAVGTTLTVTLDAYDHDGVAVCPAVAPSTSVTVAGDRDDDGVPDTGDSCPDVHGPTRVLDSGCPLVRRRLDTSFADGVLSGTVRLVDPTASRPGACSGPSAISAYTVEGLHLFDLWSGSTRADGTFAAPVGRLAHGTEHYAMAEGFLDPTAGICQTVDDSGVFLDRDGDSVGDAADECPEVPVGGASEGRSGCPVLARQVTARYSGGTVSGDVRLAAPADGPQSACVPAGVVVYRVVQGAPPVRLTADATDDQGHFHLVVEEPLEAGTVVRVVAEAFPDGDVADCEQASSEEIVVAQPDRDGDGVADRDDLCAGVPAPGGHWGCPKVEQTLTSKYDAAGVLTGRLRVLDPDLAPGACLSATVQLVRTGADGVTSVIASKAVESDGSYRIVLAQPLAGGDVYFAVAPPGVDRELAFCAGGRSAARVAPGAPAIT